MYATPNFRIDQEGLKLLRNRFCYQTIQYSEISKVEIFWGGKVRNSLILFFFGLSFLIIAVPASVNFWNQLSINRDSLTHLEHAEIRAIGANLILIICLLLAGAALVTISLQKSAVMKVNHTILVSVPDLAVKDDLEAFIAFLKLRIPDAEIYVSLDNSTRYS